MAKDAKPKGVKVRCLGVGEREHSFVSADPTRNRVCPRCRSLLAARNVGLLEMTPRSADPAGNG